MPRRPILACLAVALTTSAATACTHADSAPVDATQTRPSAVSLSTEDPRSSTTFISECVDSNLVRAPRSLTLTCADANSGLDELIWQHWGADTATATGVVVENTCEPTCSEGTLARYPATVTATDAARKGNRWLYRDLTISFTGERPSGAGRTQHYPLPS